MIGFPIDESHEGAWCQWLACRSPKPKVRVRVLVPLPQAWSSKEDGMKVS